MKSTNKNLIKSTNKNLRSDFLDGVIFIVAGIVLLICVITDFLWKYRKTIIRTLIVVASIAIIATTIVMGGLSIATGIVEESAYQNHWQAIDVEDYEYLMALRSAFAVVNPIAAWLYRMVSTVLGYFARLAIILTAYLVPVMWFERKHKKRS